MTKHVVNHLKGSIAPQGFGSVNNEFVYYEKLNPEEGRFFTYNNGKMDIIHDIYDAHGLIEGGHLLSVSIGPETSYRVLTMDSQMVKLTGVYFDFKIDSSNNVLCLGHDSVDSVITVVNQQGEVIRRIEMPYLFFASSLFIEGEYIYVSGFTKDNKFKIVKINYIGVLLEEYIINTSASDRLISKLIVSGNYMMLSITGKNDSVVILDMNSKKIREFTYKNLSLDEILDINVVDNVIYILSNKKVYSYEISYLLEVKKNKGYVPFLRENIKLTYIYFMIISLIKEYFLPCVAVVGGVYTLIWTLAENKTSMLYSLFIIWSLGAIIALFVGLISIRKKSKRVNKLLDVQRDSGEGFLQRGLFLVTIFISIISLLFNGDFRIINVIIYAITLVFTVAIDYTLQGYINHKKEDIVIELLDGGKHLTRNIKSLVSESVSNNKLLINIKLEDEFSSSYLAKWNESRGFIIGGSINYVLMNKTVISVVDLTNRDIKYSKTSILSDLISYIEEKGRIKEVNAMWID
ncbi:MAG: hypothetical protein RSA01_05635 [Clostridium sp.]|uniref:hypothetical protein n=1 Tax=Clostridium sp. TaxID=1506 RepID=UPI002FCA2B52